MGSMAGRTGQAEERMRVPDRSLIVAGLAVFLVVVTFPAWYNAAAGRAPLAPALERPTAGQACVAPREYMRTSHMTLLAAWQRDVVRRGDRTYVAYDGHHYEKSLTATCLRCHASKANFCDRCHSYAGVAPACTDCHVASSEKGPGIGERRTRP